MILVSKKKQSLFICFNSLILQVFQEIFENFKLAMKKAMIDYVLLSPQERARLHI